MERTFYLPVSVYPYWLHQILYPSTRQYVTSYVDVFHSGNIGPKKKRNGVYALLMLLSQPIVVEKVQYYEKYLFQLKMIWGKHMAHKNTSIIFTNQFLPQKLLCPMVYNFLIWNQPVTSFSHLSSVITERSFLKLSLPKFT